MQETRYTVQEAAEGERFYNILRCVPEDKQDLVALMAEAFINGMNAQEQLAAKARQGA